MGCTIFAKVSQSGTPSKHIENIGVLEGGDCLEVSRTVSGFGPDSAVRIVSIMPHTLRFTLSDECGDSPCGGSAEDSQSGFYFPEAERIIALGS